MMGTRYLVTVVEERDGMQVSERQAYLEEALAAMGVGPSTNAFTNARMAEDEIEALDAAVYDENHEAWERDEWRERAERYEATLKEITALEKVDPDGKGWTWKDLFLEAQARARLVLWGVVE